MNILPIPLNEEQKLITKNWAADDRLWTTQETVAFNLESFARSIIRSSDMFAELERLRSVDATKTREINTLVAENRALIADMERMREQASGVTVMLSAKLKALNYYRAGLEHRRPAYVPARVRLEIAVCADVPQGEDDGRFIAYAGDYDCESNQWGAISVIAANGNRLGIKPCEFDVLEWRDNDK